VNYEMPINGSIFDAQNLRANPMLGRWHETSTRYVPDRVLVVRDEVELEAVIPEVAHARENTGAPGVVGL
jgi:hypothetical protein